MSDIHRWNSPAGQKGWPAPGDIDRGCPFGSIVLVMFTIFIVARYRQSTELKNIPRRKGPYPAALTKSCIALVSTFRTTNYRYASHNDVSVNDGPHIRRSSQKIIL